ncbi:MAG: hypothetical protein ACRDPF_13045 [Streptosporangiaceae bacterium]
MTIYCLITWPSNSATRGNAARRASAATAAGDAGRHDQAGHLLGQQHQLRR